MADDFLHQLPVGEQIRQEDGRLLWRLHIDFSLLLLLIFLSVFGLAVLYSANGREFLAIQRQAIFLMLGFVCLFITAQLPQLTLRRTAIFLYGAGVLLLIAVMFMGVGAKGAQRWLDFPGLPRFQPSEIMKLAIPLILAFYFDSRALPPRFKDIAWSLIFIFVPVILIARQPDLGTSLLIAFSGFVVLFMAGIGWRYLFGAVAAGIPFGLSMWFFVMRDYQRQRVLTLLDPDADKWGAGWNIIQSTTAIGSGGWSGKGWLEGTQSHLDFLPEGHTDFIIAVLAEEFGFVGVLLLLLLYVSIVARCLFISVRAQNSFGRLLGASVTATFFFYVFVNMGMVSGILPIVGVPLPLVSQGGTSIITLMVGFGLLMSIATDKKSLSGY